MKYKIIGAFLGVLGVLAALWYIHGLIYSKGFTACENAQNAAAIEAGQSASKEKAKNDAKYKSMETDAIDRIGRERGWMRPTDSR